MKLKLPPGYHRCNSSPEDPPFSVVYGMETKTIQCSIMALPIKTIHAIPFDNVELVEEMVCRSITSEQSVVEVCSGNCRSGNHFIYLIIETIKKIFTQQYFVLLEVEFGKKTLYIRGFFTGRNDIVNNDILKHWSLKSRGIFKLDGCKNKSVKSYGRGHKAYSKENQYSRDNVSSRDYCPLEYVKEFVESVTDI